MEKIFKQKDDSSMYTSAIENRHSAGLVLEFTVYIQKLELTEHNDFFLLY